MKNNPNSNDISKIEDIIKPSNNQLNLLNQLINMLLGFLLSISTICGEISPFGISICTSVNQEVSLVTSIGALIGYLISQNNNMIYIIAIIIITSIRWLFYNIRHISSITITFLSIISSSLIFMIISGNINFYNIIISLSESIMASGATFFFIKAKKILNNKTYYKGLENNELSILLTSFIIILIPLMSIILKDISLGKIIAIYSILLVSLNIGAPNSAVIGMIIGLVTLLNGNEQNAYVILSYGIGGFLAGLVNKYGNLWVTSIFIIINGSSSVIAAIINNTSNYHNLFELLIASIIFILTSKTLQNKISLIKDNDIDTLSCDNAKNLMLLKLSFAANTLHDIANTTQKLYNKSAKNSQNTIEEVYHKSVTKICGNCNLKMFCWNTAYNDIINSFNNMTPILKQNGKINKNDVSYFIKNKCNNIDEIISTINQNYNNFITQKGINRKVSEIRSVITDQFDSMSIMLKELAKEFCEISQFDKKTSIKAKKVLSNIGLNVYSITSFIDKYGRLTIEATINNVNESDRIGKLIALKLSDICERNFNLPSFIKVKQNMKLTIIEKATYEIDFGVTQLSHNNSKNCGDSYNYFTDSKGKAYMILSDGMGTGRQAEIDGTMTTNLLSRLIKAGFEFESALKIVNSTLLIKSDDESLSTVDVTSIDLYTGQTNMFKAGAAPTFTRKSDKVLEINCSTLPAGILSGVSFDKKTISLKNKDIIIMVSDGITNNEYDWLYNEIKSFKYNISAKELSRKIALESKFRNKLYHDDDVTVMVGIILKGV